MLYTLLTKYISYRYGYLQPQGPAGHSAGLNTLNISNLRPGKKKQNLSFPHSVCALLGRSGSKTRWNAPEKIGAWPGEAKRQNPKAAASATLRARSIGAAPAALPGLGFLFVLSQTEEAVAEFGNQPCHPPWKRPWVPAAVGAAPGVVEP